MKMYPCLSSIAASVLFLSGCVNVNWTDYRISNVPRDSKDLAKAKAILHDTAARNGMKMSTYPTSVPDMVVIYDTPGPETPLPRTSMSAQFSEGDLWIRVDGGLGLPVPANYEPVKTQVGKALGAQFGSRCKTTVTSGQIPAIW